MAPYDAQRQCASRGSQLGAVVRGVLSQVALAQRFEHAGDRAGRHPEGGSELAGGSRLAPLQDADLINRFDVVFDG